MEEYIVVGQIINTHGIKGEVKVYPLTDNRNRFKELKYVYIDGEKRDILNCKLQVNKVILKIKNINTIEEAIKYKNKYISVDREQAVTLPEGRYYTSDVTGCRVIDTDHKEIGDIFRVIETGSNDVFWVKGKKEVLIPVIEEVVTNINIDERIITIRPVKEWNYED